MYELFLKLNRILQYKQTVYSRVWQTDGGHPGAEDHGVLEPDQHQVIHGHPTLRHRVVGVGQHPGHYHLLQPLRHYTCLELLPRSMIDLVRLGAPGAGAGGGQLLAVHIPGLQLTRVPAAGELLALRPGHGVVVDAGPGITHRSKYPSLGSIHKVLVLVSSPVVEGAGIHHVPLPQPGHLQRDLRGAAVGRRQNKPEHFSFTWYLV